MPPRYGKYPGAWHTEVPRMHTQLIDSRSRWPEEVSAPRGNLVLSGYGLDVRVWRGRLLVEDGIGLSRRRFALHRATGGLKRLIVLGHTGAITFDAIRWLHDVGAGFVQIDADGNLLAAWGAAGYEQPRLRRAQAKALGTHEGLTVAKALIDAKLAGQRATLDHIAEEMPVQPASRVGIEAAIRAVPTAGDENGLRKVESDAAAAYWAGWAGVPMRFVARDESKVPGHWHTFGTRTSGLKGGPRAATNPINAMFNFLYALLEAEAVIAAQTVGLDPGIGINHVDARYRASMAADLMEPVRPSVDRYVFDLLSQRAFAANDFFETRAGVCRLVPSLAAELAATRSHWGNEVGQVAEQVAHALVEPPTYEPLARLFTRPSNRRVARRPPGRPDKRTALMGINRRCAECGKRIADKDARTCSPECLEKVLLRSGHALGAKMQERIRAMREAGDNPQARPEAKKRMAAGLAKRQAERAAWEAANPGPRNEEAFRRDVMPRLAEVSVYAIRKATGLSTAQAWRIRKGRLPHPMWWEALESVVLSSGSKWEREGLT